MQQKKIIYEDDNKEEKKKRKKQQSGNWRWSKYIRLYIWPNSKSEHAIKGLIEPSELFAIECIKLAFQFAHGWYVNTWRKKKISDKLREWQIHPKSSRVIKYWYLTVETPHIHTNTHLLINPIYVFTLAWEMLNLIHHLLQKFICISSFYWDKICWMESSLSGKWVYKAYINMKNKYIVFG